MIYQWIAIYDNNECLPQYPKEGVESKYSDIDRSRITQFVVQTVGEIPRTVLVVHIPKDGQLIYRQRNEMVVGGGVTRVLIVGSQSNINGKNNQFIAAIFEDEHIEMLDRWIENSRWFQPPILHPHEGEVWDGLVAPEKKEII